MKKSAATTPSDAAAKPNIVLILAGDVGSADLGFTGNKLVKTPNLA